MHTEKYTRTHPFTIITYLKGSVILLLLPVLQQLLYRPENAVEIIGSMGLSAVYAFVVLFFAFANYGGLKYQYTENRIFIRSGVLIKRRFYIDYDKVHVFTVKKRWLASLFGAVNIGFDTSAGGGKRPDVSFWVSSKKLGRFFSSFCEKTKESFTYHAGNLRMALMAASWSNPGTGLLIIAPFVSHIGNILGSEFQKMFYQTFNVQLQLIALGLPPAAATVANILIFGWAAAMIIQFFRYARFSSYRRDDYLVTVRGLFDKYITITRVSDIAALSINQSLTMALFELYSTAIFSVGFGKEKGDKSLIVIAEKKRKMYRSLKKLVSIPINEQSKICPSKYAIKSYLIVPVCVTAAVIALLSLMNFFEVISELFKTVLLFALIPLTWWMLFRVLAHKKAMLAVNDKAVVACGYKGLTSKKYIIPYKKIQYISIKQNIFQRRAKTCDVRIYLYFEKKVCHTVKHLPLDKATELVEQINRRIK